MLIDKKLIKSILIILFFTIVIINCTPKYILNNPSVGLFPVIIGKPVIKEYRIIKHFEHVINDNDCKLGERIQKVIKVQKQMVYCDICVSGYLIKTVKILKGDGVMNFTLKINMSEIIVSGDVYKYE